MVEIPSTLPASDFDTATPPTSLPQTMSADEWEAAKNPETGRPRININKGSPATTFETANAAQENNLLAARQQTTPYLDAYKDENVAGPALMGEDGTISYKDDKGNAQPTDSKKHVVIKTPDKGYVVYNRTKETNMGAIHSAALGISHAFTEGYATGGLQTGLPSVAGEVAAAAARQGIRVPQGMISPSDAARSATIMAAKVPYSGQPVRTAAGQVAPQIEQRVGEVAESASPGGVMSQSEAGAHLRNALNDYLAPESKAVPNAPNLASTVTDEFKNVDPLIKAGTTTDLPKTRGTVFDIVKKYVKAGMAKIDDEGNITTQSKAVQKVLGPTVKAFKDMKETGKGLDYETVKFVRTAIGKLITKPGEYAEGLNEQELKQMYGSLTDDLRDTIHAGGGDAAVNAWEAANASAKTAGEIRGELTPLTNIATDEGLFGKVWNFASSSRSAGVRQLALVRDGMTPGEWKNVSASIVSRLGINARNEFDPVVFSNNYSKLSEEGKNILFGASGQYRQDLEDIAKIAGTSKPIEKVAETGGHGVGLFGGLAALEAFEQIRQMGSMKEVAAHVATVIPAIIGTRMFANMMANPASTRTIARWMRAVQDTSQAGTAGTSRLNSASQALVNDIRNRVDTGQEGVVESLQKTFKTILDKASDKLNGK